MKLPLRFRISWHCRNKGNLTVAGLEVPVDNGDDGLVVEVEHPSGDLHGPVHQRARGDTFPCEGPVQRASPGELHDQTQVGLLQTHPQQRHDVGMVEHGEEFSLLAHALQSLLRVLIGVPSGRLHRHLWAAPHCTVHFPESAHADDFLQGELWEINLQDWEKEDKDSGQSQSPETVLIFTELLHFFWRTLEVRVSPSGAGGDSLFYSSERPVLY